MQAQLGEFSPPTSSAKNEYISQLLSALKQAGQRRDFAKGKQLHLEAVEARCYTDKYVATALLNMYSRCRRLDHARAVFDNMIRRDVPSWNSLILGYVENQESLPALDLFANMDCEPNAVTYVVVLKACMACRRYTNDEFCVEKGIALHKQAKLLGFEKNIVVANTLLDMYCKCGRMHHAKAVFDSIPYPDVCSWTSLVLGYLDNGESLRAMDLFLNAECEVNCVALHAGLKACSSLVSEEQLDIRFCLEKGISVHKLAKEQGLDTQGLVTNTLINLYCKCGSIVHSRKVFDMIISRDVVSWTNIILCYVENNESLIALELFRRMDCEPDSVMLVVALKACSSLSSKKELNLCFCLELGMEIHKRAKCIGVVEEVQVANTLLDMYCKSGSMLHARTVFDCMDIQDVVSWTSLILGYVNNGECVKALNVFTRMECEPNLVTYIGALRACGGVTALGVGKHVHGDVLRLGLEEDEVLANILVDFYGKCSNVTLAELVFSCMQSCGTVSWNALLAGYGSVGDWTGVVATVEKMVDSGTWMDSVTFLLILTACKQAGKVEEAKKLLKLMTEIGVSPTLEHYTCLVDTLGKNNRLEDALEILKNIPFSSDCVLWTTLLETCKKRKDAEGGKHVFSSLMQLSKG